MPSADRASEQGLGVRRVQSRGWLIEHIYDTEEIGAYLGCEAQALEFAR
jgi:hypothetical protein